MVCRSKVRITKHAKERKDERLPEIPVTPGKLGMQIAGALKAGCKVRHDGTIAVPVGGGWLAICAPSARGGWVVITFLRAGNRGGGVNAPRQVGAAKTFKPRD